MRIWLTAALLAMPGAAMAATVLNTDAMLVNGSASISQTNIGGRVMVGGDFTSTGTSNIGGNLNSSANGTTVLGVGGNLNYPQSTVSYGNIVYGGSQNTNSYNLSATPNGTTTQGTVNVSSDWSQAVAISNYLAQQATTGTVSNSWGNATLTGTAAGVNGTGVNVYNISLSDLSSYYQLNITGGTAAIINVFGNGADLNESITLNNSLGSANVLFNFVGVNNLHFYSGDLTASILAVGSAIKVDNTVEGSVIGASLTAGGATINGNGYSAGLAGYAVSQVSAVPEPASWLILIGGFGLVGWTIRRGRGLPWLARR